MTPPCPRRLPEKEAWQGCVYMGVFVVILPLPCCLWEHLAVWSMVFSDSEVELSSL